MTRRVIKFSNCYYKNALHRDRFRTATGLRSLCPRDLTPQRAGAVACVSRATESETKLYGGLKGMDIGKTVGFDERF